MNKKIISHFKLLAVLLAFTLMNKALFAQQTIVEADPALSGFDILGLNNVQVDANSLLSGQSYFLTLDFQNLHLANAIPSGTATVRIGFGTKMILDPTFVLSDAGHTDYITWNYDVSQSQPQIYGVIHTPLPALFAGTAKFKVKMISTGNSLVSGNFLITNTPGNPFRLVDPIQNNTADINYTVVIGGPVPVTLTKFNASKKDCIITSNWSVENEVNFSHYELQVSNDGRNFTTINTVTARNIRDYSSALDISSLAASLQGNNLFLRLKMVDRDATFKYSNIVPVNGNCDVKSEFVIYGYPNPLTGETGITVAVRKGLFNGKYNVGIVDMAGRILITRDVQLANVQNFRFEFGTMLAAGKYMILVQQIGGEQKGIIQIEKLK